jgi:hypothetical protein
LSSFSSSTSLSPSDFGSDLISSLTSSELEFWFCEFESFDLFVDSESRPNIFDNLTAVTAALIFRRALNFLMQSTVSYSQLERIYGLLLYLAMNSISDFFSIADPRMSQSLYSGYPFIWINLQHAIDQLFYFCRH